MSYYFFTASLPEVNMDAPVPINEKDFIDQCRLHLAPHDFSVLQRLLNDPAGLDTEGQPHSVFEKKWYSVERQLCRILSLRRSAEWNVPPPHVPAINDFNADIERRAAEIAQNRNPFERETQLDKLRWYELDEMETSAPFSAQTVFAYGLKLKISARHDTMTKESGSEHLRNLLAITPGENQNRDTLDSDTNENNGTKAEGV